MTVRDFLDVAYINPMWTFEIKWWHGKNGCYESRIYRSIEDYADEYDNYPIDSIDIREGSIEIVIF